MRSMWFLLAALFSMITAAPSVAVSQESSSRPQPPDSGIASAATEQRYDGYRFLDADGRPLPFQSDDELEHYLENASLVSVTKIPVGVTRPRKVLLANDGVRFNAVFKDIDVTKKNVSDPPSGARRRLYLTWRDSYEYDIAAYHVDRLLGLDRVPPIVIRKVKGTTGSLQIWLEETITENDRREKAYEPPDIVRFQEQRQILYLFDNLVANRDSNLGNSLIDVHWRLWFIDCSRCFGTSSELLYPEAVTHCERTVWKALRGLDRASAEPILSPYLERAEIRALFERRDKLVDHIQKLIDQWGEDIVLFDLRPPAATAPWAAEN